MTENHSNEIQAEIARQQAEEDSDFASRQAEVHREIVDTEYAEMMADRDDDDRYDPIRGLPYPFMH